jgi:hypothetical protein
MKDFTRFGIVLAWLVALGGPFAQRAAAADADFMEAKKHGRVLSRLPPLQATLNVF